MNSENSQSDNLNRDGTQPGNLEDAGVHTEWAVSSVSQSEAHEQVVPMNNTMPPMGVNILRRDGTPRCRFSESERLIVLGDYVDELDVFCKLFVRRKCPYIIQRQQDGKRQPWRTVEHAITNE